MNDTVARTGRRVHVSRHTCTEGRWHEYAHRRTRWQTQKGTHTRRTDQTYLLNLPRCSCVLLSDYSPLISSFDLIWACKTLECNRSCARIVRCERCFVCGWQQEMGGGALLWLCSAQCRTQETVALQRAESRSAPSSVSPSDDECDLS